jgi:hypothetical protein
MTRSDIAIATITLARDAAEEHALRASLAALVAHDIPVFVADGGSPESFVAELRSLANTTLVEPAGRGLVRQVSASVGSAARSGATRILYTEPDKHVFFERHLSGFLATADADVGVTIAARAPDALATFPPMQRATESAINGVCAELVGRAADYCYGPFLLDAALARHVDILADDLGWGWRFAIFVAAHREGLRVEAIDGPFECPPDQRDETDRDRLYRLTQLEQNVRGVLAGERLDLHRPRTIPLIRS